MAAVNYYYGLKRGAAFDVNNVVVGTSTAGTAVDVELRVQINNGTNATNITRQDTYLLMEVIENFIKSGGNNHSGTNVPAI